MTGRFARVPTGGVRGDDGDRRLSVVTRPKKTAPSLEVRNVKTEAPLGITWDEAVEMLAAGYACEHVAKKTGFPVRMLERELKYL